MEENLCVPLWKTFEIKAPTLTENCIKGAAAVMGNMDRMMDVIFPGFFKGVLKQFLQDGAVPLGHDWENLPVAMPAVAREQANQLYTEAIFHSTQKAQDARTVCMERMERGLSVGLSVGFMPDYEKGVHRFQNGKDLLTFAEGKGADLSLFDTKGITACKEPCRGLTDCAELYEYSIVSVPANPAARATSVKAVLQSTLPSTVREFEAFLREAGYSRAQAVAIASRGFQPAADGGQRDSDAREAETRRDLTRRALWIRLRSIGDLNHEQGAISGAH